jgi:hypothetical protein
MTAMARTAGAPISTKPAAPKVRLGRVAQNGISPSLYGLIERGAVKRPRIASALRGTVEIRFKEGFAPVRVTFEELRVVVEDGDGTRAADLVIQGSLPDIVQLAAAPLVGGLPAPTTKRGRAALARVAGRKVRIQGSPLLARRLLKLLEI